MQLTELFLPSTRARATAPVGRGLAVAAGTGAATRLIELLALGGVHEGAIDLEYRDPSGARTMGGGGGLMRTMEAARRGGGLPPTHPLDVQGHCNTSIA